MNDLHSPAVPESATVTLRPVQEDSSISFLDSLFDILQLVLENLRLLVLLPLAAGLLALGYSFTITPTFTAVTRLIPPQQAGGASSSLVNSIAGFAVNRNPIDQYVTLAKSDSVRYALIERFKLMGRYRSQVKEDARDVLDSMVRVNGNVKDGLITIELDDHDPAFAAELANANVEELNNLLQRLAITEARQRRIFYEKQLLRTKSNLAKAEQELKTSSVGVDALKAAPGAAVDELARLKAGITAQEIKVAGMRGYLAQSAPEFKQAQLELSAMQTQLARTEQRQPADSSGGSDYVAKYREVKYYEFLVEIFFRQYETARADETTEGAVVQVVDRAEVPEYKSKPKKMVMVLAAVFVSEFFVLFFIFARHAMRNILRHVQEDPKLLRKLSNVRKTFARALGRG
jgi:tyrosine-protein kinase Etk/Wzc